MMFLSIIGPFKILTFSVIYFLQLGFAIYLVSKYENGWKFFLWLAILIFLPVIGTFSYFTKSLNKVNFKKTSV
jgi:hypothetical protein